MYPADDLPPASLFKRTHNPPKVRASITAGTILIVLSGRFRGKRVVCMKPLPSGLLLISGPFCVNGVPLRRVNPAYVIATSTKIDVSKVDVADISDEFFARVEPEGDGDEEEFFQGDTAPAIVSDARRAVQKKVDGQLMKVVSSVPKLKQYLNSRFSLKKGDKPHEMVF
mmetsp:Transcript_6211/g.13417  ORF Transcript_6211/g.13417 Transcript_6211/m.13417 type:complete len:169 (+) Transcript_6211:782-1288(+)|eukprot:CAMPEP_0113304352 /NCGR_PEP_ID=MMETSP0010_2-20120614/4411_1 /TAXON_ID=216773 ORGANISM="Corethron hystrix, Strain 308" /NCGR_SAMPLE_ID=MMETSP0010_2 /ASSEMBLY_ACC=CAM_ASM_000155 /LENGTH=168 /DNA_ID=CAMNT_0000158549 /DNA_START=573 /DNA_END=1079 /DNA_ORIENTATION=- /assembly_acc=CAM_ASM_000155